jgi:hypothetical protein
VILVMLGVAALAWVFRDVWVSLVHRRREAGLLAATTAVALTTVGLLQLVDPPAKGVTRPARVRHASFGWGEICATKLTAWLVGFEGRTTVFLDVRGGGSWKAPGPGPARTVTVTTAKFDGAWEVFFNCGRFPPHASTMLRVAKNGARST